MLNLKIKTYQAKQKKGQQFGASY